MSEHVCTVIVVGVAYSLDDDDDVVCIVAALVV